MGFFWPVYKTSLVQQETIRYSNQPADDRIYRGRHSYLCFVIKNTRYIFHTRL